ncbi:MAG TPA: molybdopterin-dependent oxidoreductase, partial [Steroidobacteraceae bacterium]|nr:molybdopterin-dependent oxidoreductase [Steroidobacteraceae bacterium]
MFIRRPQPHDCADILPSEITPQSAYLSRREMLTGAVAAGLIANAWPASSVAATTKLTVVKNAKYSVTDKPNTFNDITTYNNFYEFGTDKQSPAENSGKFNPQPWKVKISGEAEVTGEFSFEDLLKGLTIEERVYRMRCVEAWSMIIPWDGVQLADVIKRFKPTSKAKYVAFKTIVRPTEMPGQQPQF